MLLTLFEMQEKSRSKMNSRGRCGMSIESESEIGLYSTEKEKRKIFFEAL